MKLKTKYIIILAAPIIFGINIFSKYFPKLTDAVYSTLINKYTIQFISLITGLVPFSIS